MFAVYPRSSPLALRSAEGCFSEGGYGFVLTDKQPMDTPLDHYRRMAIDYFRWEFSDVPLSELLRLVPNNIAIKVEKVIALHFRIGKPPSEAACFMMRLFRPRFKNLIKVECYEP
jgi:hypothetical protein